MNKSLMLLTVLGLALSGCATQAKHDGAGHGTTGKKCCAKGEKKECCSADKKCAKCAEGEAKKKH